MPDAASQGSDGSEALASLFDADVCCAWSAAADPHFELLADETATTQAMTEPRLAEFRHGRCCARRALAMLGRPNQAVPVGPGRAPVWPADIAGSIAHHGEVAAAVVAPRARYTGIGIDIEPAEPVEPELVSMIAGPGELAAFGETAAAGRIAFCVKESLFKCLWPFLQRYFDFLDVALAADGKTRRIRATPAGFPPAEAALFERLELRYTTWNGLILAAAFIAADERRAG